MKPYLGEPLYFCNPSKNKECSKKNCFINGGECKLTLSEEFAIRYDDNTPLLAPPFSVKG